MNQIRSASGAPGVQASPRFPELLGIRGILALRVVLVYYRWIVQDVPIDYFQWTPISIMSCFGAGALISPLSLSTGSRASSFFRSRVPNYLGYGEFLAWRELPSGHYILADVDRLRPDAREAVARRLDALVATRPKVRVLNHPLHSLGRGAPLGSMHRAGVNDFRAAAVGETAPSWRFPVFIRHAVDHTGPQTPLIEPQSALDEALRMLAATPGIDPADHLVVEYVDVRNAQGLHEKYSALRVGDRLFANDLSVNTHWVCKGEEAEFSAEEWLAKDLDLQNENPHAAMLMPLFESARIEYGRMDYGFSKGRLQVFEINTNPFVQPPDGVQAAFRPSLELRKRHFVDAMMTLHGPDKGQPYFGNVPGAQGPDRVDGPSAARRVLRSALRGTCLLQWEHSLIRWRNRFKPDAYR